MASPCLPLTSALGAAQRRLLEAAVHGDLPLLKRIARELDGGVGRLREAVEAATHNGAGALHAAAAFGRMDVCAYLVEEVRVDIRAADDSGKTPLDYAFHAGNRKIEKYLLEHGANLDEKWSQPLYLPAEKEKMENNESISWEDNYQSSYVNWERHIPPPSGMVLPDRGWRGKCIGHAFAECISSRRRIMASKNRKLVDMDGDVSIPWLVNELSISGCITQVGGKALDVSEFILNNGAPLEGRRKRAYISDFILSDLVNLQDTVVFDLPEVLNRAEFMKALQQRALLLVEMEINGPVIGLFNAGLHWPDANGEIYYDHCDHAIFRSKSDDVTNFGAHAALVYGFDNTTNDPFSVELMLQDSMGQSAHTKGRCRMNISSLRGYISLNVACSDPRNEYYSLGASMRWQNLIGTSMSTNQGENDHVNYAVSFMQGWCENVEDAHSAFLGLDDSLSFFGVYDGHGGPGAAFYCENYFRTEVLKHEDYHNNSIENAMKAFFRLDEIMVGKQSANIWPSVKETSFEGSTADRSNTCITLIRGNKLVIGNAGHSLAIISRNGQAHAVASVSTRTARATREVIRDGSGIPQILSNLDTSKVIGVAPYKDYTNLANKERMPTCDPDINTVHITDDIEFLLMASDGVWDQVTSQSAVDFIHLYLKHGETDLGAICERLLVYCNAGHRNMTVMLIQFKRPAPV